MNVLVTGGTGFIGSHTVVELQKKGFNVFIIDNLSNSRPEVVDAITEVTGIRPYFYEFDICQKEKISDFFQQHTIHAMVHFAAHKAVGESVEKPLMYYRNNIVSLLNLLDQCVASPHPIHLVFSSSCTVYGEPDYLPVDEKAPIKPAESPYGNTKKMSEDIIRDTSRACHNKAIALRYFNPVGAHDSALIGEYPLGRPNNLMPIITQTAIGKLAGFNIFGNDYDTPDGSCIRDYIHVVDLARAHVVAIERMIHNKNKTDYEVFNIGTGNGISVVEMVAAFEKMTGEKLNYTIAARRAGDVVKVFADTKLANEELGWKAELNLEDMVKSAWAWEQKLKEKGL
ncbi:MAG: UDP-glucose 4-epimerase GalE [Bacteroidetes bacterium]|nr:UDP-glucose 4-epimerase GalE [Bacteroidota bacterium]